MNEYELTALFFVYRSSPISERGIPGVKLGIPHDAEHLSVLQLSVKLPYSGGFPLGIGVSFFHCFWCRYCCVGGVVVFVVLLCFCVVCFRLLCCDM
jgi:hypothetical protein